MMNDKIDLQEKLRASNWKAEDLFDEIKIQEDQKKNTPEITQSIEEVQSMSDPQIMEKYTADQIVELEKKQDKTPIETEVVDRYKQAVYNEEAKQLQEDQE